MGMASNKMYVPENESEIKNYFQDMDKKDTNIIFIGFSILKQDPKKLLQIGDPILCKKCGVGLSCFSIIEKAVDFKKLWRCEYCDQVNMLQIDDEEIPKKEDCLYLIESINEGIEKANQAKDINLVFCIDYSGSMGATKEIEEKLDWKHSSSLSQSELETFKQFMEPWEYNQMIQEIKNSKKTFVSRRQCVLAAIESQLEEMKRIHPNRQVGLVTFNNEVSLIGDGFEQIKTITGDKLYKMDVCFDEGKYASKTHISNPISLSSEKISETLNSLKEIGQTALGPAVAAGLGMASQGLPGSILILCTDGIANIGIGSLEDDDESKQKEIKETYDKLAEFANENGITINVITITGEGCKLDIIGSLADKTNGIVTKVSPESLSKDFANILKGEIIGMKVELKGFVHKGLRFRKDEEGEYENDGSVFKKKVGNVTEKSEISFEYDLKHPEELKKLNLDLKNLKHLPFQAQVSYTTKEGRFLRIITKVQEISNKIEEVERIASIPIISNHATRKSCKMTLNKCFDKSKFDSGEYFKLARDRIAPNQKSEKVKSDLNSFQFSVQSLENINDNMKIVDKEIQINSKNINSPFFIKKSENLPRIEEEEKGLGETIPIKNNNDKLIKSMPFPKHQDHYDSMAAQIFDMKNNQIQIYNPDIIEKKEEK